MSKLDGKVALITGGSSGIGFATARLFVSEGANVIITGRNHDAVMDASERLGSAAIGVQGDVSRMSDLDSLFRMIGDRFGRLDILFANAGVMRLATIDQVSEEQFDNEFNVNVKGLFFTVQKALPLLVDGASVILTSSIAHFAGVPSANVYSATKAAVRSFARSWTAELKDRRIRVNSLSPGSIDTPIIHKLGYPSDHIDLVREETRKLIPLGRVGDPEEIANAVLFLASSESSYITGIDLCVDGGFGQI